MQIKRLLSFGMSVLILLIWTAGCRTTPAATQLPPTHTTVPADTAVPSPAPTVLETPSPLPPHATRSVEQTANAQTATATLEPSAAASPAATPEETATVPASTSTEVAAGSTIWVRNGNQLSRLDTGPEAAVQLQQGDQPSVTALALAPDGSYIAFGEHSSGSPQLVLHNLRSGARTVIPGMLWRVQFAPDSQSIVYLTGDPRGATAQLIVRDLASGETRVVHDGAQGAFAPIAWTADGIFVERLFLFSDAPPQNLYLVDPGSGTLTPIREQQHIKAMIAPEAKKAALITGYLGLGELGEAGLTILDLVTGREQVLIEPTRGLIPLVRWNPDATKLVHTSASNYGLPIQTLHILNADGSDGRTLQLDDVGLNGSIQDMAWPDAERLLLLVSDSGGEVRLYELLPDATPVVATELASFGPLAPEGVAQVLITR